MYKVRVLKEDSVSGILQKIDTTIKGKEFSNSKILASDYFRFIAKFLPNIQKSINSLDPSDVSSGKVASDLKVVINLTNKTIDSINKDISAPVDSNLKVSVLSVLKELLTFLNTQSTKVTNAINDYNKNAVKIDKVEHTTDKATLVVAKGKRFWVQTKWIKNNTVSQKVFDNALPVKSKEEVSADNKKMLPAKIVWENDKAVGYDIEVSWASSLRKRVRIFLPKSMSGGNTGDVYTFPKWLLTKSLEQKMEGQPSGWFVSDSPWQIF